MNDFDFVFNAIDEYIKLIDEMYPEDQSVIGVTCQKRIEDDSLNVHIGVNMDVADAFIHWTERHDQDLYKRITERLIQFDE
jgi:hypothetical protein